MNGGALNYIEPCGVGKTVSALQTEVMDAPKFGLLSIGAEMVFAGTGMMRWHAAMRSHGL